MRETLGQILGVLIVVVAAWFIALSLMAYSLGDILPWHWTVEQRAGHLMIQVTLVIAYFIATRTRPVKPGE